MCELDLVPQPFDERVLALSNINQSASAAFHPNHKGEKRRCKD